MYPVDICFVVTLLSADEANLLQFLELSDNRTPATFSDCYQPIY
jgi:hypothetical protein